MRDSAYFENKCATVGFIDLPLGTETERLAAAITLNDFVTPGGHALLGFSKQSIATAATLYAVDHLGGRQSQLFGNIIIRHVLIEGVDMEVTVYSHGLDLLFGRTIFLAQPMVELLVATHTADALPDALNADLKALKPEHRFI